MHWIQKLVFKTFVIKQNFPLTTNYPINIYDNFYKIESVNTKK